MSLFSARVVARSLIGDDEKLSLIQSTPLVGMHLACLAVFYVGVSWAAVLALAITYAVRVFALTGGYHRYFSHRSYKTSRVFQFLMGFLGASAAQLGPLWWASHHRHHHQHSDQPADVHSPLMKGVFRAHIGWLMCPKYALADEDRVRDLLRYPELRLLDRFHALAPLTLAAGLYGLGVWLNHRAPALGVTGGQMLVWGFFVSTVMVYHVTFCINSATHLMGTRRFETGDDSRNHWFLAFLTMGEGWHNNHHRYPASARQGFYAREIDVTYYLLLLLGKLRLIWDIRSPPPAIYAEAAAAAQQKAGAA